MTIYPGRSVFCYILADIQECQLYNKVIYLTLIAVDHILYLCPTFYVAKSSLNERCKWAYLQPLSSDDESGAAE